MGSWAEMAAMGVVAVIFVGALWRSRLARIPDRAQGTHIRHPARLVAGGGLRRIS